METKQARNPALLFSIILLILASVNVANSLPNPCRAAPTPTPNTEPPTRAPDVVPPTLPPSLSPPPAVTVPAPAPTPLPKCPPVSADLGACVTLGLGNNPISSSARQQCCSQISKLGSSTATTCLCDAMKADVRVGVNVSIPQMIAIILNLCGQATTSVAVCVR